MENCLFKYIFSKWTSLAIVELNLWLKHSLEVNSPDPPRKLRKNKFPGFFFKHLKIRQKSTGGRQFGLKSPGMYEGIRRHERKLQINLSTSHAERVNLPGHTPLSTNSRLPLCGQKWNCHQQKKVTGHVNTNTKALSTFTYFTVK